MPNPSQAALDLCRAFQGHPVPDWPAAHAAILAGAPVDTPIPTWSEATLLIFAAMAGNITDGGWLLAHGADPNARDKDGWTVLMVVALLTATESAKDFIATLLDHGADPAAMTPDGRTAPEVFMAIGRPERTGYLDEALASDHRAAARRRLLDRLTADQRLAWLPKACAAEAAMAVRIAWRRAP